MIRIVTDSSCDLPDEILDRHRITVVPLTIRFGDEEFIDREQLSGDEFWERLIASEDLPETAAPSVGRFQQAYTDLADEGADGIVAVMISSGISATHQSATLAAEQFVSGIPVKVIDSGLVSAALGLALIAAARAAEAGGSIDDVESAARGASAASNLFATLDTLEFLKRGGRIGGAAAFFGNLLSIKPLITFSDGVVSPGGRVRTRKKAVRAVLDHLESLENVVDLGVVHSDPPDLSDFLAELSDRGHARPLVARLGPVVGTHAGPGVIGLVYRIG
ncbi:MAG: DegV family protein [Acidimicrobiia bacterium]